MKNVRMSLLCAMNVNGSHEIPMAKRGEVNFSALYLMPNILYQCHGIKHEISILPHSLTPSSIHFANSAAESSVKY